MHCDVGALVNHNAIKLCGLCIPFHVVADDHTDAMHKLTDTPGRKVRRALLMILQELRKLFVALRKKVEEYDVEHTIL